MNKLNRKLLLIVGLGIAAAAYAATNIYDGLAIDVFPAHDKIGKGYSPKQAVADGRRLFLTKFNVLDGAGRPFATEHGFPTARSEAGPNFQRIAGPDANSCAGCHNQPVVGGSGDFAVNVFVGAPQFGGQLTDSISAVFSNERNTRSLFGIGGIEIAATEMSMELTQKRDKAIKLAKANANNVEVKLSTKGINFGSIIVNPDGDIDFSRLSGIGPDLVVKPFGSKGTVTSIREFTIVALNQHHGIQPTEFFGKARTGSKDFDGDKVEDEFSVGQTTALTLFQAAIPAPDNHIFEGQRGFVLFKETGCVSCHVPTLHLKSNVFNEPNYFNREGVLAPGDTQNNIHMPLPLKRDSLGYVLNAFTDLKRHVMCDEKRKQLCNETKKQDKVPLNEFMTTRLWDLNTSAPYCHRGDCTTLTEAIEAHGGEAGPSVEKFDLLSNQEKESLVRFLKSLGSHETTR